MGYAFFSCITEITVEQLQKYPLRPFVIVRITGSYFPVPVVAKANLIQLTFEMLQYFFQWYLPDAVLFQWHIVLPANQNCQSPSGAIH